MYNFSLTHTPTIRKGWLGQFNEIKIEINFKFNFLS